MALYNFFSVLSLSMLRFRILKKRRQFNTSNDKFMQWIQCYFILSHSTRATSNKYPDYFYWNILSHRIHSYQQLISIDNYNVLSIIIYATVKYQVLKRDFFRSIGGIELWEHAGVLSRFGIYGINKYSSE